jgi:phosphatidylglycerol:prolipoprotein diacylglycerol transferase
MNFPVYIRLGSMMLHPHWVFETLGYSAAVYWFRRDRRRVGDVIDKNIRFWVIGAAAVGGLVGSRVLYLLEDPVALTTQFTDPAFLLGGKTIVGGLIGGLIAVEWIKRRMRVAVATGDLLVLPLTVGIAIGRIGCFLSGLPDQAHGTPTRLPWGVNFGDGISRHPTQLYEIGFLVGLAGLTATVAGRMSIVGDRFKLFMLAYMTFRFAVDFIKPAARVGGLSVIQWACVAIIAYYAPHVSRVLSATRRS